MCDSNFEEGGGNIDGLALVVPTKRANPRSRSSAAGPRIICYARGEATVAPRAATSGPAAGARRARLQQKPRGGTTPPALYYDNTKVVLLLCYLKHYRLQLYINNFVII